MGIPATRAQAAAPALRVPLADGAATTVHVAAYAQGSTEARVVVLRRPEPLAAWCARRGVADAIVGGFFQRRSAILPLGEVRTRGVRRRAVEFDAPWASLRACVHIDGGRVAIAPRDALPRRPRGDLLQAGPRLVAGGRSVIASDPEGFSAGAHQFDSDITDGRYPRAALGVGGGLVLAVACDGRSADDAGMTLAELAELMVGLGAEFAINLDGGGSTSLVCDGELVNRPREEHGIELAGGRPVCTAIAFRSACRVAADDLAPAPR